MSAETELPLVSRLHAPTLSDCTPKKDRIKFNHTGHIPYVEAKDMYRPEGMTEDELKAISQYGQRFETNEKLNWNDLYGHATILKQYSGFGGTLDGVVPHGVYSPFNGLSSMELCTGLPRYYSWLDYEDHYAVEQGKYEVVPMAAPFIYAMANLCYDITHKGKGTIFIPYHSTDIWDFDNDWYDLVMHLRKANYPEPLAVLLFFEDVRKKRHRFFQKKGIPVYTCGDKFRPEFLYQFIHVVRNFENVLINDISTPAFYAAYMGKNVIAHKIHGDFGVRYENNQSPWPQSPNGRAFPDSAYCTMATPGPQQRQMAQVILRECAFQFPEQMKTMFEGGDVNYALQERQTEAVHAREASEDCCQVGQEVRRQGEEGVS